MKLYYSKGACSLAIRIVIHEIGLTSEFESVNLKTKQTEKGQDFLKINPKGAVPALVTDDNEILTENAVIQQYLADKNKATQLLPSLGDFKRYRVLEWLNFISTDLHKGFGPLFNPKVPQEINETLFKPILISKFKLVEGLLQQKKYLLGESFTLPDAYMFVMLFWLHKFQIDIKEWPNLDRYFAELKHRKAIQTSLEEEGFT